MLKRTISNKYVLIFIIFGIVLLVCKYYKEIYFFSLRIINNITKSYDIEEFENFLTPEECDKIIELASPKLFESKVYSSDSDITYKSHRVSKQTWLEDKLDPIIAKLSWKTAELVGKPIQNQELLQVVKYDKGGFFNPHYDACSGNELECKRMNQRGGSRYATLLIYLNDDFEGGETIFPIIGKSVKPKKGNAILFYDSDKDGNLIRESFHGGNPIINGNKWICNKWIRINDINKIV